MKRNQLLKRGLLGLHKLGLRFGLIILPKHYYVPVADIDYLAKTRNKWAKRSNLSGVQFDLSDQIENLKTLVKPYQNEYQGNSTYLEGMESHYGPGFGYIEAQALHGFIRATKPARIIEVGSGVSTHCMMSATELNARETGKRCSITCIEPHPSAFLKNLGAEIELESRFVETLDPAYFDQLQAGDLLFIDSSHAVRPGGDVIFLFLEVIPRLKPGVLIHIHDIYLPFHYNRDVLKTIFQASETSVLQALLVGSGQLSTIFCLSLLHYDAQDVLKEVFPEYRPQLGQDGLVPDAVPAFTKHSDHFPSSIYLKVTGER